MGQSVMLIVCLLVGLDVQLEPALVLHRLYLPFHLRLTEGSGAHGIGHDFQRYGQAAGR
ncbi:hypothetical protein D3C85_1747220 [compost metagenome]